MKLTLLGANGGTGQQVARQAIGAGHDVTAIVRRPDAIPDSSPQLRVVRGDLLDPQWTGAGIDGADAVLSAIGPSSRGPTTLYSAGTAAVLKAMDDAGIRRILVVSAAPVGPDDEWSGIDKVVRRVLWQFFRGPYEDMRRMEQILAASDTDWTVFRPPRLTNGPLTGHARTAVGKPLPGGRMVSRADLAAAMLAAINDPATVRQAVAIAR
jgi:putative NADH-flavin reductase